MRHLRTAALRTIALGSAAVAALAACMDAQGPEIAVAPLDAAVPCDSLAAQALPGVAVTLAEVVPAGGFTPAVAPGGPPGAANPYAALPAFCRIAATLTPVAGSEIKMELWMPTEGWNGKFLGAGNGGFAGAILTAPMADPLRRGYAVANTDTGHAGNSQDASFGAGRPEAIVDFAYRAVHEMTVTSKALAAVYYGGAPAASYWVGCSTGGRQGLANVQHYPEDYDAVVAGAPANNMARLQAHSIMLQQAMTRLPTAKLSLVNNAAIAACDANDGLTDRVIGRPDQCSFDPAPLACAAGADEASCLTPPELDAARSIYAGTNNPRTGESIYPAPEPGSEAQWAVFSAPETIGSSFYRHLAIGRQDWDFQTFDFDRDVEAGLAVGDGVMQTQDPAIADFVERGGKLLLWHGVADPLVTPGNTIDYYESVEAALGAEAEDSVRLFLAPSVGHCGGGEGYAPADLLTAIETWYETGETPEMLLAAKTVEGVRRTRTLCPYPEVAQYDGAGDPNDAASFSCVAP